MLCIQHFFCRLQHRSTSKVPCGMVLERLSLRSACPNQASFRLLTDARRGSHGPTRDEGVHRAPHPLVVLVLREGDAEIFHQHHHHQSLNREGRWSTTDDLATSFLHFSLFSTALWDSPNSRRVHSLMLSSHLFLCLPCLLLPLTVPCKMVLPRPDERETRPYHCSLRLFTIVRRSSCGPIACWILARTSSLVTWSFL